MKIVFLDEVTKASEDEIDEVVRQIGSAKGWGFVIRHNEFGSGVEFCGQRPVGVGWIHDYGDPATGPEAIDPGGYAEQAVDCFRSPPLHYS